MTYSIFHSTRALQTFLELLAAAALALAILRPKAFRPWLHEAERRFSRFAVNRRQAIFAAVLFPLAARLALLPFFGIPQPRVHDEFSYLLLGDTFAHGRLSNPVPPQWQHFETEYELLQPVYASQYEPAQGLALAAGQLLIKNPWWGVWLTTGLMCGALCWALGFAVPPRWTLFGSLLAALQFGIFGFWMNSYFGGAAAAIGGALAFGGVMRRSSVSSSLIAGTGIAIVLASRPAEGLIWLCVTPVLMARRGASRRDLLVLGAVLAAAAGTLAAYNARVTGNALLTPYSAYRKDYGTPQSYWWQPAVIVSHFDNPELAANYQDQLRYWQRRYSAAALADSTWHRLRDFWRFYIGPFLTPALLGALFALRRKRLRPWLFVSGLFILDHATYHAWYPQQSASETVLILFIVVEGWRSLRLWRVRTGAGVAISRNLVVAFAAALVILSLGLPFASAVQRSHPGLAQIWDTMRVQQGPRDAALHRLETVPGKHLVFVRYSPHHPWYDEWVFNGADIPGSRVVFARMCSPESDMALARSMKDRDVWIASPDTGPLVARVTLSELLVANADNRH
jgi:hypothetical protein